MDSTVDDQVIEHKVDNVKKLFDKLSILNLSPEKKEEISAKISRETKGDLLYWTEVVLSSMIATFGLLQNSVAVIIGAMLIAPLLRPIQGFAFAIATGYQKRLWRSFKFLFQSVVVSILVGYLFSLLVPIRVETVEILSRTQPTLLDLLVAMASAAVAILALAYSRLSESIAGVAMAAALMPPLAVVGIELSFGNLVFAWGSFLLFITNLLAICVVGVMLLFAYGFSPHQYLTQKRMFRNVLFLCSMFLIILFPLFSSLVKISQRVNLQYQAKAFLNDTITKNLPNASLSHLEIKELNENFVHFLSTIKIPENSPFFLETKELIRDDLGQFLNKNVNLDIEIIPIASIESSEQKLGIPLDQKFKKSFSQFFETEFAESTIIDIKVGKLASAKDQESKRFPWGIKTIFSLPAGNDFSIDIRNDLEVKMKELFPQEQLVFFWVYLPEYGIVKGDEQKLSIEEQFYDTLSLQWENFFRYFPEEIISFENLFISWDMIEDTTERFIPDEIKDYDVKFDVYILDSKKDFIPQFKRQLNEFIQDNFIKDVSVDMKVFLYSQENI